MIGTPPIKNCVHSLSMMMTENSLVSLSAVVVAPLVAAVGAADAALEVILIVVVLVDWEYTSVARKRRRHDVVNDCTILDVKGTCSVLRETNKDIDIKQSKG